VVIIETWGCKEPVEVRGDAGDEAAGVTWPVLDRVEVRSGAAGLLPMYICCKREAISFALLFRS